MVQQPIDEDVLTAQDERDQRLVVVGELQDRVKLSEEAYLLKREVFARLHPLAQFEYDSRPVLPMILCGQDFLLDHLMSSAGFRDLRPQPSGGAEEAGHGRVSGPRPAACWTQQDGVQ